MFGAAATHLIEFDQIHGDTTKGETVHHQFCIPTIVYQTNAGDPAFLTFHSLYLQLCHNLQHFQLQPNEGILLHLKESLQN